MLIRVRSLRFSLINIIIPHRRLTTLEIEVNRNRVNEIKRILLIKLHTNLVLRLHFDRRDLLFYLLGIVVAGTGETQLLGVFLEPLVQGVESDMGEVSFNRPVGRGFIG